MREYNWLTERSFLSPRGGQGGPGLPQFLERKTCAFSTHDQGWNPLPPVTFDCLRPPCFHHLRVLCFSVMLQPTPTTFGPKLFYTCVDTRTSIHFDYIQDKVIVLKTAPQVCQAGHELYGKVWIFRKSSDMPMNEEIKILLVNESDYSLGRTVFYLYAY